jgi:hypothetical protein
MRKKPASSVLASLRRSTYGESTFRLFARCGLAGRLFAHPAGYSDTGTARELITTYYATIEFLRTLLAVRISSDDGTQIATK